MPTARTCSQMRPKRWFAAQGQCERTQLARVSVKLTGIAQPPRCWIFPETVSVSSS